MNECGNGEEKKMPLQSMFFGDEIVLAFLMQLTEYLADDGRAIIALNSLIGIQDVFERFRRSAPAGRRLTFRLLDRYTFPLSLCCDEWATCFGISNKEFESWLDAGLASFLVDSDGRLHWFYEIIECRFDPET
jgi:release factor glutamine methyltransferase